MYNLFPSRSTGVGTAAHRLGGRRNTGVLTSGRRAAAVLAAVIGFGVFATAPAFAWIADARSPTIAQATQASSGPRSSDAQLLFAWVIGAGDNHGMPFVIVDKRDAMVFVFDGRGQLLGATSALLGLAVGDDSAPGVGDRKLSEIRPQERTTPAGRFVAYLGHGRGKQDILWVDYDAALALHRVLAVNSRERRLERLATVSPLDHRITFGCINVPVEFYDRTVQPAFTGTSGVVYILPEVKTVSEVFFATS